MDRNTIIAVVLIGLVIILMPVYYKWIMPEKPPQEQPAEQPKVLQPKPQVQPPSTEIPPTITPQESVQDTTLQAMGFPMTGEEETVEVDMEKLTLVFSTHGAKLIRCVIHGYHSHLGGDVQIIREDGRGDLVASFRGQHGELNTEDIYFTVDKNHLSLKDSEIGSIVFRAEGAGGAFIEERYDFVGDRYDLEWSINAQGVGSGTASEEVWLSWEGGLAISEADSVLAIQYSKAYAYYGNSLIKYDVGRKDTLKTGDTQWVAVRNRYFEAAIIAADNPASAFYLHGIRETDLYPNRRDMQQKVFQTALIDPMYGRDYHRDLIVFLGPLDYWVMKAQGHNLQKTLDWGWDFFRLTVPILWVLKTLHSFIPNYGVVLIVFSVLVKFLVWPLTHKSHESMKRMQVLQPLIKELREKYKDDMQRLQKETMKLYKEHKVNPMGGCLPVLIQMPLFIALFSVFRSTIELRGAPFIFWITDLSAPDYIFHLPFSLPLYGTGVAILPIIMGISTYFQSKLTMTDPNQKMMLYFMPIFLILIFNKLPSGLTLYYTLFNFLTLAQQRIVKTHDPTLELAEASPKPRGKPKK
jgi:YidC/Oxa1 family membrane protein insertase